MEKSNSEVKDWLGKVLKKIEIPLKSKTYRKKINDIEIGIQFYRSRYTGDFYIEFKIYNDDVCSFGENGRRKFPIFDQRLYQKQPSVGEKSPGDFWMSPNDLGKIALLKQRILEQGLSIFENINSLDALLKYYKRECEVVYFQDWKYNQNVADMWAAKIEGYLGA